MTDIADARIAARSAWGAEIRATFALAWPLVLIIAAIQGGGQLILTLVDPVLSTFLATTAALIALYPLSRWRRYAEPPEGITECPAIGEQARIG